MLPSQPLQKLVNKEWLHVGGCTLSFGEVLQATGTEFEFSFSAGRKAGTHILHSAAHGNLGCSRQDRGLGAARAGMGQQRENLQDQGPRPPVRQVGTARRQRRAEGDRQLEQGDRVRPEGGRRVLGVAGWQHKDGLHHCARRRLVRPRGLGAEDLRDVSAAQGDGGAPVCGLPRWPGIQQTDKRCEPGWGRHPLRSRRRIGVWPAGPPHRAQSAAGKAESFRHYHITLKRDTPPVAHALHRLVRTGET